MNGSFLRIAALMAVGCPAMLGTTVTMSFNNNSFPTGSIGPYIATVNGTQDFVFCDDDTHSVYPNETWQATVTSLSSLIALGNTNIASSSVLWKNLPSALTLYEQAAWLVNEFGTHSMDASGIQNAIWDIFLQKTGSGSNSDQTTDSYWLLQASNNYKTLTSAQIASAEILSPIAGTQSGGYGLPQEFITLTPEPATYVLFGAGVILLGIGSFRRTAQKDAA
ncbi:MAG TPA: PEP-CTERM sorting domain-containing protein [Bryobacteraceae bacterium]|jgi:hypothetical protein